MASTTTYRQRQVVVVEVPFSNHSGAKPRPALIVSTEEFHHSLPDVMACPISSQPRYYRRPGQGDCPIREWQAVGLRHPSTVRVSKLLPVDKRIIRRVLGRLSRQDFARVEAVLRQALDLG